MSGVRTPLCVSSVFASSCKTPNANALARVPPPEKLRPMAVSAVSCTSGLPAAPSAVPEPSESAALIGALPALKAPQPASASVPAKDAQSASRLHGRGAGPCSSCPLDANVSIGVSRHKRRLRNFMPQLTMALAQKPHLCLALRRSGKINPCDCSCPTGASEMWHSLRGPQNRAGRGLSRRPRDEQHPANLLRKVTDHAQAQRPHSKPGRKALTLRRTEAAHYSLCAASAVEFVFAIPHPLVNVAYRLIEAPWVWAVGFHRQDFFGPRRLSI